MLLRARPKQKKNKPLERKGGKIAHAGKKRRGGELEEREVLDQGKKKSRHQGEAFGPLESGGMGGGDWPKKTLTHEGGRGSGNRRGKKGFRRKKKGQSGGGRPPGGEDLDLRGR